MSKTRIASKIHIFSTALDLAENLARNLQEQVQISTKIFPVALSGGRTPKIFFECLAGLPFRETINWKTIHFFWGDERCVPPDHVESNYRMTRETLFEQISVPAENIHRIHGENVPSIEAERYGAEMINFLEISEKGQPVFDWIILGMGTDGHTASLFPKAVALQERNRYCVATVHPETGQNRISLTLPVINAARRITFLVTGSEKAELVGKIIKGESGGDLPAGQVQPLSGLLEWYLDEAAASLL